MPRVNLDEEFFVDPRIDKLARLCREIRALARGRLLAVYHHCYITRNPYKTADEVDRYAEWDGEEPYASLMSRAGLAAATREGLYRISGVEKRITYLISQSERGRRSAMSRMMKTGSAQPIPKKWKKPALLPLPDTQNTVTIGSKEFEQTFEKKVEIVRTMVRSSSNQSEKSLCISSNLGSESSNEGSKRFEHLLSSNQLTLTKEIPRLRPPLSREQIEEQKRAAFKWEEESRSADRTAPLAGPPTACEGVGEETA